MRVWTDSLPSQSCVCLVARGEPVIYDYPVIFEGTHNEWEYLAIFQALVYCIEEGIIDVEVMSDSQLAVRQLNGEYQIKNITMGKWVEVVHRFARIIKDQGGMVTFTYCPREENLAGRVLDGR